LNGTGKTQSVKKILRSILIIIVILCLAAAYFSAAGLSVLGVGYLSAYNGEGHPSDYTDTSAFKEATLDTLDRLYLSVTTDTPGLPGLDGGIVYFAFGLASNRVVCSDSSITDIPTFEETYLNGSNMEYVCRVSGGVYTTLSYASGAAESEKFGFADSAEFLGGEIRRYDDCVIIFALPKVGASFSGFGLSRFELAVLSEAPMYIMTLFGILLVSLAIVIMSGSVRRRIERKIGAMVVWTWFEFKLALLGLAVWFTLSADGLIPMLVRGLVTGIPLLYCLGCNARYYPSSFFRKSFFADLVGSVKAFADSLLPVLPLQIKLRHRIAMLVIFGFAVPIGVFFLADALIGAEGIRLILPFYVFYLAVAVYIFVRHYIRLCNGVSDLIRGSSMIALGAAVPEFGFEEDDDLYPLAQNLTQTDRAAAASADRMFLQTNKKLSELKSASTELRDMISVLEITIRSADAGPELAAQIRNISDRADSLTRILDAEAPLTAPVLKRCDLLGILDEVVNAHLPELSAARLSIRAKLPSPPAYITADPSHIHAMLSIIFDNLAKYTLSGSRVELSLSLENGHWVFEMVNTVAQSSSSVDAKLLPSSTGLIRAREYVELNGGRLERTMDGEHFKVSFSLPAAH